jgi:hypothetical protein
MIEDMLTSSGYGFLETKRLEVLNLIASTDCIAAVSGYIPPLTTTRT